MEHLDILASIRTKKQELIIRNLNVAKDIKNRVRRAKRRLEREMKIV